MEILTQIYDLLRSPRFVAFYWLTGIGAVIGFLGLIVDVIPQLGLSEFTAVVVVAIIGQITKALNNLIQKKEMGFAPKK